MKVRELTTILQYMFKGEHFIQYNEAIHYNMPNGFSNEYNDCDTNFSQLWYKVNEQKDIISVHNIVVTTQLINSHQLKYDFMEQENAEDNIIFNTALEILRLDKIKKDNSISA